MSGFKKMLDLAVIESEYNTASKTIILNVFERDIKTAFKVDISEESRR